MTCDIPFPHTHLEFSGYHHRNQETEPHEAIPSCLFCVTQIFYERFVSQDFSDLSSHEMSSFSLAVLILETFLLRYWNPFELALAVAFAKQLINLSFMWRGERDIFRVLARGM